MKRSDVVSKMTLAQKAEFVSGLNYWYLHSAPELELPEIMMTDGPHGLRKQNTEKENRIPVYDIYVDDGFSGTNFERPDFKRMLDECEWIVVENTHEPIIDKGTWNLVHDIMKNRRRETKRGEVQMFAGLVKCADCGSALNVSYNYKRQKYTGFSCWVYKNYGKERCTSHAIGYQTLYNIVLEDIRRQAECVAKSKDKYVALLSNHMNDKTAEDVKSFNSQLRKIEKRLSQLDKVLNKLYEDRALEKITEERYLTMNGTYESEYNELILKQSELKDQIEQSETAVYNAKIFTDLVEKYINITELNSRILNELIEKIVVHEKEIISDEKYQTVEIYYRFVGLL